MVPVPKSKGKKAKATKATSSTGKVTGKKKVGSPVVTCPWKTGSIAVSLVHHDGKALPEAASVVLKDSAGTTVGTKSNKKRVAFRGLKPGDYTVVTTLATGQTVTYKVTAGQDNQGATVTAAKETRVQVTTKPPGNLTIKIVAADTNAVLGKVTVNVQGPTPGSDKSVTTTGKALFLARAEGDYKVSLVLPPDVDVNYHLPLNIPDITMPWGTNHEETIKIPARPGPRIEIADPKTVLVKRQYHGKDKKWGVEVHRIEMKLSATMAYDGIGELTSSSSKFRIFDAETNGTKLDLPLKVVSGDLGGKSVWIEATGPSASKNGTRFKFELKNGSVPPRPAVTDQITCLRVTLEIYKSRVKPADEPVMLPRDKQFDPGRPVFKQKNHGKVYFAERAKLVVKKAEPADWDGTLVLEPINASVSVFDQALEIPKDGQTALTGKKLEFSAASVDDAKGKTFWVEGTSTSSLIGDTGCKVWVKYIGADYECDRVVMSVVKAELKLFKSRTGLAADGDPAEFSEDDKYDKGRYLHKQVKEFHGRARVVVKKVKPDGFEGTLQLRSFDVVRKPDYKATQATTLLAEVFEAEVPATGQTAKANPFDITHDSAFPAEGKEFWIQGKDVSKELIDIEMRLGMKDFDHTGCDRAAFTVVSFKKLTADVPSTPPNTVRAVSTGGGSNGPVARHEFKAGEHDAEKQSDHDFTKNLPLPLVENSVTGGDPVKLSVEIEPAGKNVPILWSAIRAFDDDSSIAGLSGAEPTITPDGGDVHKATFIANSVGSFRVRAYIDCNENTKFDERDDQDKRIDREPFIILNLVSIRCEGVTNNSVGNSAAGTGADFTAGSFSSGDFAGSGNDAANMDATIHVVGGGADGMRGLEYLFCGWLNNETNCPTAPNPNGWGEDVTHHHSRRPTVAHPTPTLYGLRCYWAQGGTRMSGPVLDSGYAGQGTGGNSCTGTQGANSTAVTKTGAAKGQNWQVTNYDSPGGAIYLDSPADAHRHLVRFNFNIDFQSALIVWTNASKVAGPSDHAANRLYSYVYHQTWNLRFEATRPAATPTAAMTIVVAKTCNLAADNSVRQAQPVQGSGIETRQPDGLDSLQADQPFNPNAP